MINTFCMIYMCTMFKLSIKYFIYIINKSVYYEVPVLHGKDINAVGLLRKQFWLIILLMPQKKLHPFVHIRSCNCVTGIKIEPKRKKVQ